jgi:periplasmic protein TonB
MRKVYQPEKSNLSLVISLVSSVVLTAVLFGVLPFAHHVATPKRPLELFKTDLAELPPDVKKVEEPPPTEAEKPPEMAPPPQLADAPQQMNLNANLDVAEGGGGFLKGFGNSDIHALTAVQPIQEQAFDVGDLDKRPVPISQVSPAYPSALKKAKIPGSVTLVFLLNEEGRVEDARVENSTRPEFEKPALDAVRRWRFQPGMKDGKPVRTYIRVPIRFSVSSG